MRAADNPLYKSIIGVFSAQSGKTDAVLNLIGHDLDDDPAPIIYIGPTRKNVEKVIEPRIQAMMHSAKNLYKKLSKGKQESKTMKIVSGVPLMLGWAGSATEAASMPARRCIIDERDRMGGDVGGEGDIKELIDARHSTYPDGSTTVISTPTIGNIGTELNEDTGLTHWKLTDPEDVASPIWQLWQEGTRHEWAWPCPDCGEYFIPRFELLQWPDGSTPKQAEQAARMACPHCGVLIEHKHKQAMNAAGVPVAPGQSITPDGGIVGEDPDNDTYSLWVSGLCSPWRSWGQRAASYLKAVASGNPQRIQAVINTQLAELYRVKGDAPEWQTLRGLVGHYSEGSVPPGVLVITASVDVQKDRLFYSIRGWGLGLESWLIRCGELFGETDQHHVWEQLAAFREMLFDGLPIVVCTIDSGYRPGEKWKRPDNIIYEFCRRFRGWARPTKGHDQQRKPLQPSMIDVSVGGKVVKKGLQLWHLDSDFFKSWVHTRLEWPPGVPGQFHLHKDTTEDYMQQLVNEARAVKPSGHITWIRTGDNHYLDCEAGNVAAAYMLQVHTWTHVPDGLPNRAATQSAIPQRNRRTRSRGIQ